MASATYIAVAPPSAAPETYARRRRGVLIFATAFAASLGIAVQDGLADRGGDPASTSAVSRATTYIVQPGDTLWAIAERLNAGGDIAAYVDALIALNGGTVIIAGQQLALP